MPFEHDRGQYRQRERPASGEQIVKQFCTVIIPSCIPSCSVSQTRRFYQSIRISFKLVRLRYGPKVPKYSVLRPRQTHSSTFLARFFEPLHSRHCHTATLVFISMSPITVSCQLVGHAYDTVRPFPTTSYSSPRPLKVDFLDCRPALQ